MRFFPILFILFTLPLAGKDFAMIQNGVCNFAIALPPSPGPVLEYGAKELSELSGRLASKGKKPLILPPGTGNSKKVILLTCRKEDLSPGGQKELSALKEDGFILEISRNKVVIFSGKPLGVLYGIYEILKKYGGIRFLVPGEDGTYLTGKDQLLLPAGICKVNPDFRIRTQILGSAQVNSPLKDTWTWLVRNNMQINGNTRGLLPATARLLDERSGSVRHGGHAFDALMTGAWITCTGQEARKKFALLQKEHKEYFPIINKKRSFGRFASHNPCVAAPGLDKLMSGNLAKWAEKYAETSDSFIIGNNDITKWCECEKCDKYDPVPRYRARIKVPNRYWDFVNRIATPVLDQYPNVNLWGWAYQNFNMAPDRVKPDPRLSIMLVYNRHCYRHSADDPDCPVNKEIFRMMKEWRKFPNLLANWDQVEDALSIYYLPMGKFYADRIKLYKKMKFDGLFIGNYPPDGIYPKRHDKRDIHRRHTWKMNWMDLYTSSRLLWDSSLDYNALKEEAGTLYYGKGWQNGMKEYHSLREKAFLDSPGCFGWGHDGSEPTRLIRDPFLREKLSLLLRKALESVRDDKRSSAHIQDDIFYFKTAYLKRHEAFEKKLKAFTIYTAPPITLDGRLTEKAWKEGNIYSTFRNSRKEGTSPASPLLSLRGIAGEDENFYLALSWKNLKKDARIQIYFPGKTGGNRTFLTLDSRGKILPGESTPPAGKACKSCAFTDPEGILHTEIRIPESVLSGKLFPGSTFYAGISIRNGEDILMPDFAWKGDEKELLRVWRVTEERRTHAEGMERNHSRWQNGSLDEIRLRPLQQGRWRFPDKASPLHWGCADNNDGILEMPFHPGEKSNRYVKMQNACLLAPYRELSGRENKDTVSYKLTLRCGGRGKAVFQAYWKDSSDKSISSSNIGFYKPAPDGKWQDLEITFPREKNGAWFHLFIRNQGKGEVLLDDIYICPVRNNIREK